MSRGIAVEGVLIYWVPPHRNESMLQANSNKVLIRLLRYRHTTENSPVKKIFGCVCTSPVVL